MPMVRWSCQAKASARAEALTDPRRRRRRSYSLRSPYKISRLPSYDLSSSKPSRLQASRRSELRATPPTPGRAETRLLMIYPCLRGRRPALSERPRSPHSRRSPASRRLAPKRPDQRRLCFARRSGSFANCSHFSLLGQLQCIFDLNSEVADRTFKLGVTQQELDGAEVFRVPVNQCRFCAAYRVRAIGSRIKTDFLDPSVDYPGILARAEMR
jgi:hypothetical protein